MGIREDVCKLQECVDQLKVGQTAILEALAGINPITIQELCDKTDAIQDCVDDLKDELLGLCPMELVAPLTTTTAVVEGDETANYSAGDLFNVTDAQGNNVGTAEVVSSSYDSNTDQTTFTLTNNTVAATDLAQATTIKKKVSALRVKPTEEGEGKKAEVATRS